MHIPENIKLIRQVWNKTQEEFGKIVGGTKAMIQSYERGLAEPKMIIEGKIASLAGVSVEDLRNKKLNIKNIKSITDPKSVEGFIPGPEINMGDRAIIITLRDELLKMKTKVYGISLQEALKQFEDDTTLRLNELLKQN